MKRRLRIETGKELVSILLVIMLAISVSVSAATEDAKQSEAVYLQEELTLLEKHRKLEKELLEWYAGSDAKTLETAIVHQDLYEMAPLTAVLLFETELPETVNVTVHGKTEDADISYTADKETHHEIQIFGLYPDYENTVTIVTESGNTRDFIIRTDPVPETMTRITKKELSEEPMSERLFYVCDKWRTIFDRHGDIRWYMTGVMAAFSGIDEIDYKNHCFWISTEGSSASMATVYCVSFTGKMLGQYFYLGKSAHHDATLLPDGKLMYLSKWRTKSAELSILDPETGKLELYMDPQELFDDSIGSLEYSTRDDSWDFLHINSVEYIPANDSLLLSFRNQHMIMSMDYKTRKVNWVLTPAYKEEGENAEAIQSAFSDVLILPKKEEDFEWFYSQHSPRLISYDSNSEVYDIVLFDNGTDRFLASESGNANRNEEKYSRLVRYQIDAKNKTVKQIYEFGQDYPEYYSDQCGSAQYIMEENRYVANFPCLEMEDDSRTSIVTESDENGKLTAEYELENIPDGSYRTIAYDMETFITTENVISNAQDYTEVYQLDGKKWEMKEFKPSVQSEVYQVDDMVLTDHGLRIKGQILGIEKEDKLKIRLLAIDSVGKIYAISLINYGHNKFYLQGIDMKALPKETYQLAIDIERNDEEIGYKMIPYLYTEEKVGLSEENTKRKYSLTENTTNWDVEILDVIQTEELKTIVPVTQYDLSIDNVEYLNHAQEGMRYLLLNMKIKKSGSGSAAFSWKNVILTDINGDIYTRSDDIFLENHGYDRMPGTDIKMGSKTGWICFEIPEESEEGAFTLEYQGKDGERLSYIIY
ncbi:MAG: aryl-sulfate sulfotransferase [Eubacteriales bacterium]|nr:aryl-sulfate sulfotransferase [Eubacteriales bacterium]